MHTLTDGSAPDPAITLTGSDTASPTFTAPTTAGVLVFELTVTDDAATPASHTDTVTITVTDPAPANQNPVADAGDNQAVDTSASVTLNGSASSDPDTGDTLTYSWAHTLTDGSAPDPAITLTGSDTASPTFTAPATAGELVFTLTVTDDATTPASHTATVTISVTEPVPVNQPPVAHAGDEQMVDTGASVTLDGSASNDPDGDTLTYAWAHTLTDGSAPDPAITLTGSDTASPTFTAPTTAGVLVFELTVTDDAATPASHTDTVTITVTDPAPANQNPVADAGDNQAVDTSASVTLNGSASSDPDTGDTLTYSWAHTLTDGSAPDPAITLTGSDTASPTFTAPATAGELVFTLTVTDDATTPASHTATVTISVTEPVPVNQPPVAHAGDEQMVDTGASVTLDGSASNDPDGDTLTYAWAHTLTDGSAPDPAITLTGSDTASPTFTAPTTAGELVFTLTVTDNATPSASHTDTVTISVTRPLDTVAPVLTFDRFEHEGGLVDGVITRLNAGDTITVFVNSDEPLADSSLMDAAIFIFRDEKRPAQELMRVGVTNQYMATYTIEDADHGKVLLKFSVSGVMDADSNTAADFTSPLILVSIDTEPPTITLAGISPVLLDHGSAAYNDAGVNGLNTQAGETVVPTIAGPGGATAVDTSTAGDYLITYTATDRAGNVSTLTRTVTVGAPPDTVAPVITLRGASPVEVALGDTYTDPGATASDDRDGDLSASIALGGDTVDTDTVGDYTLTYDVSDAAGNAAETVTRVVRVVIVRDLDALNRVILPEVARAMADQHVSAIARRIEQARLSGIAGNASSASLGGASNLTEIIKSQGRSIADDQFDMQQILGNSNFVLPLRATDAGEADGTQLTLWGAGDYRDLEGAEGVRWDGDLLNLQVGLDAHLNARTILGVSVSRSQARLDYTDPSLATTGDYDLDMTSVHPYLGWSSGGLDFWATLGYGNGEVDISEAGAQDFPSSDLSMRTLALGASGLLMETGVTSIRLKGEALSSTVKLDGNAQMAAMERDVSRLRMTLEASRNQNPGQRRTL